MKCGKPDRFAAQFDAFGMVRHPVFAHRNQAQRGEMNKVNDWGCTVSWAPDQPGAFPVHTPETIVIKDMAKWRDYVKAPPTKYSEAEWEPFIQQIESIDRTQQFATVMMIPGIFEICHYLGEITNIMYAFYDYPEELKDLIKYITEWELRTAEDICHYLKPEVVFHHDDWGTQRSTFMSADTFGEFFLEPYKQVYGFFKDHGVRYVVHHSDSYAATLVPYMIDMGVDVWQGTMLSNDIPALIEKYKGQITFMGGIDSSLVDYEDWTEEAIFDVVRRVCTDCGPLGFAPCTSQGGSFSSYPGVYEAVRDAIHAFSAEYFAK